MARRTIGEGTYYTDARTGRVIYQNRAWIPGVTVKGRGRTRTEALANARERRDHVLAGRPGGGPETFGEMLDAWLRLSVEPNQPRETWRTYRGTVRNWLQPELGDLPAHELRPSHLEQLYRQAIAAGKSGDLVRQIKHLTGSAYTWALGDGRIAGREPGSLWNPGTASRLPEDLPEKKSRPAPTSDQVEHLLEVTDPIFNGALWRAMADCALRPSEAAGLRWQDIDIEQGLLHVRGALRWSKRLKEYAWAPGSKTGDGGIRTIPFGPELGGLLSRQRADVLELQMASRWESDAWAAELMFRQPRDGRGMDSRTIAYRHRLKIAEMNQRRTDGGLEPLEAFSLYQFRHYLPTRLAREGESRETVAELLGIHPDTARRYYIDAPEVAISLDRIRTALGR